MLDNDFKMADELLELIDSIVLFFYKLFYNFSLILLFVLFIELLIGRRSRM